jgi:hypothetical protein
VTKGKPGGSLFVSFYHWRGILSFLSDLHNLALLLGPAGTLGPDVPRGTLGEHRRMDKGPQGRIFRRGNNHVDHR